MSRLHESERRREARIAGDGLRARMRPGYRLSVIDLSTRGALVEAWRPLRPGSYVDLQLETGSTSTSIPARVVRCVVTAIDPETGVTYRAALSFATACDWVREALTQGGYGMHDPYVVRPAHPSVDGESLPGAIDAARESRARGAK